MTINRRNRPLGIGRALILALSLLGVSAALAQERDVDFRIVPEEARAFEWGIALSPDGKYLASGGDSGMVAVWDISRLRPLWLGSTRRVKMRALEYSADGSKLYGFDEDGRFWTWEALSGAIISTSPDRGDSVYTASFAPDRSWAVADSHGYEGMLWDTAKGENLLTWDNQTGIIRALAISPDGSRFLSADTENRFKYWKKGDKSEYLSRKGPVDGAALLPCMGARRPEFLVGLRGWPGLALGRQDPSNQDSSHEP